MAGEIAFFTMAALFSILFVGSEISKWRHNKKRQQLESKTPYDHALTNALNERDRLQDELRTIQALKRTEADTERIRNEIGTILSEDGEESTEDVYDSDSVHRELEAVTKRWESDMKELTGGWDIPGVIKTTDDNRLTEEDVERSYLELIDKAIYNEQKVLCIYRNPTGEGLNGNDLVAGTIVNFRYHNGQTRYLTLRVRHTHKGGTYITHISGEYLDE